jgi:hypothetical protein
VATYLKVVVMVDIGKAGVEREEMIQIVGDNVL